MAEIEDNERAQLMADLQRRFDSDQPAWSGNGSAGGGSSSDQAVLDRPALGPNGDTGGSTQGAGPQGNQQSAGQQQAPYYFAPQVVDVPRDAGTLQRWKAKGGILGAIATVLLFLAKVALPALALLGKLKILLLTGGSMLVSAWIYAMMFGWRFGVGIVLLIFVHECGHALAAHRAGFKYGYMVFVPLMGAFVTAKGFGKSIVTDAYIGIMGPIVGTLASVAVGLVYIPTHDMFWLVMAQWGFFVNLFNLLPTPPLDGGWITPLFSPKLLALGAVIAFFVGFKNPLIWLLLLASLPRIIGGWKADPKTQPYYQVPIVQKWKYGALYLGLAAFLGFGGILLENMIGPMR